VISIPDVVKNSLSFLHAIERQWIFVLLSNRPFLPPCIRANITVQSSHKHLSDFDFINYICTTPCYFKIPFALRCVWLVQCEPRGMESWQPNPRAQPFIPKRGVLYNSQALITRPLGRRRVLTKIFQVRTLQTVPSLEDKVTWGRHTSPDTLSGNLLLLGFLSGSLMFSISEEINVYVYVY
jgi:hypothetical protein